MNTTMRNRLIGLVIVLVVLFLLSWLIPRHQPAKDEHSIPVSAIAVGSSSVAAASSAMKPAQTMAGGVAAGGMTSADNGGGIQTQPYQSAGAAGTSTDSDGTQASAAQTASQYATAIAAPTQAEAPHPKPKAKTPAAAPQSHAKPNIQTPAAASYPASPGDAYIQIGSYGEMANAQKMLSSLKQKGFRARIDTAAIKGKTFYRVRVGPYVDKNAATTVQRQLTAKGYKGTQVVGGS